VGCPLCRKLRSAAARGDLADGMLIVLPLLVLFAALGAVLLVPGGAVKLFMIGDSTMADKPLEDNPERGWGQMLPAFFDSTVTIENHAKNGRSTGSFIREGLWDSVLAKLGKDDYLVIQFGHNDEKKEKGDRYTPPDAYRANLVKFVSGARAKGASAILCTPVVRRRFDSTGTFYDEHGVYPDIVRSVADSLKVPLLDMHRSSRDLVEGLGPEASKKLFLFVPPGKYRSLPEGKEDNTHFCDYGATQMATLAVSALKKIDHPLCRHLK
jgi:DNA sulfur modification protein DndE